MRRVTRFIAYPHILWFMQVGYLYFFFSGHFHNSAGGLMESKKMFGLSTVPKKRGESVLICMLVDEGLG